MRLVDNEIRRRVNSHKREWLTNEYYWYTYNLTNNFWDKFDIIFSQKDIFYDEIFSLIEGYSVEETY